MIQACSSLEVFVIVDDDFSDDVHLMARVKNPYLFTTTMTSSSNLPSCEPTLSDI